MPQKTFYLRNEDATLWKQLKDKSEFIHAALHNIILTNGSDPKVEVDLSTIKKTPPVKMVTVHTGKVFDFCKHDAIKGLCKKGCR